MRQRWPFLGRLVKAPRNKPIVLVTGIAVGARSRPLAVARCVANSGGIRFWLLRCSSGPASFGRGRLVGYVFVEIAQENKNKQVRKTAVKILVQFILMLVNGCES